MRFYFHLQLATCRLFSICRIIPPNLTQAAKEASSLGRVAAKQAEGGENKNMVKGVGRHAEERVRDWRAGRAVVGDGRR